MNIAKISNTNFKGAYFIMGTGRNVKQAETKLEKELGNNGKIHTLGSGYTADNMPAYLLVTTGNDVEKYNEFAAKRLAQCVDEAYKAAPEEKTGDDFETKQEFLAYKTSLRGNNTIDAIKDNCEFENEPNLFEALEVSYAIDKNAFDCINGEIDKSIEPLKL